MTQRSHYDLAVETGALAAQAAKALSTPGERPSSGPVVPFAGELDAQRWARDTYGRAAFVPFGSEVPR